MCAIAGIIHFGQSVGGGQQDSALLCRMRDAMAHRGPDDAGIYISKDKRALLGHRRLSIVDLSSAGHQPMSNEDQSVWIAFNGEIYNHEELREELRKKGHTYASRSDTESIIHLYEEMGSDCVRRLDGMFALSIWDERRGRLLLARDRLGKKPLYYLIQGGKLLFASEIKGLLAHPDVKRELDLEALGLYLTFANVPAPHTLFAGIRKLPAGHALVFEAETGRAHTFRYFSPLGDLPWPAELHSLSMQEASENVRTLLKKAVRKRLMADVPVGAFLSGGVDSSCNVALMSELTSEPLRTFSVGFEGFAEAKDFEDLPYARRIAERFSCRHEEVIISASECRDYLPELAHNQDEPIGDPACLPMHFVSQAARKAGIIVVLVGEGSDEVFGGYPDMVQILGASSKRFDQVRKLPSVVRKGLHLASQLSGAPAGRIDVLRRAAEGEPLYWGLDVVFWETEKKRLLSQRMQHLAAGQSARLVASYYEEIARRQPEADLLQQMSYVELCNRLPELLLMRVDKLSMAHSLEARAPFLDADLVCYALSLPQALKIRGKGATKLVLKEAVRPFLPEEVLTRKKQGFRVPLPAWLAGELSHWAERQLFDSPLRKLDLFDDSYINEMWQRHRSGKQDHSFDLWCLLNLSAWYERWIEGGGRS